MRTITEQIYTIDELTEKAKNKAYNNWLNIFEYHWDTENTETLQHFCKLFKIECFKYSYSSSSYNFDFKMSDYASGELENLSGKRLIAYIINNYWHKITTPKTYYVGNKKRQSKIQVEKDCSLTGYHIDMDILEPIYEFLSKPYQTDYYELMKKCLTNYFKACCNDVFACQEMDSFINDSEANKREYYSNGEFYA